VRLSKYTEYKNSGVDWIGFAPTHWPIKRFKHIFFERNERSVTGTEELLSVSEYYGVKPRTEKMSEGDHLSRAESLEGYKLCEPSDLVMNIMLAWKRGLGFSHYHGIVSPAYCVFSVIDGSIPDFLGYLVRSNEYVGYFKTFSSGVIDSRLRLYPEVFGRLTAVVPSIIEQSQIARFLDHETAKIDTLIHEQKRLIELLKEKRQAVISHAVTKGLDPDVSMKDSGVEWLGEVPAHWSVMALKWRTRAKSGDSLSANLVVSERSKSTPIPVIGGNGILGFCDKSNIVPPVIVLGRVGALCGNVHKVLEAAWVSDNALILEVQEKDFDLNYLNLVLGARDLNEIADKTAQPLITSSKVRNEHFPMPSKSEQSTIAGFVSEQVDRFETLIEAAKKSVILLNERRSALISAAVTGKIDVRNWQAPEDESVSTERVRQAEMEAES
jgi:type I restriction enzyme S subunit